MNKMEHAVRYLHAVEKKYKDYFVKQRVKITDCVVLTHSDNTVVINITDNTLPANIKDDIKAMFWL